MNDFEARMIEAIAILQTQVKHLSERLETFFLRQERHDERLDSLERLTHGHGERLQALETANAEILDHLEPVRDGKATAKVIKWIAGLVVGAAALAAAIAKFWPPGGV